MKTKRIEGVSKTACQPWCTPAHKCGSQYCCPEVYTVRNRGNGLIRKGDKR
ncbi:hypothetical protein EV647_4678 [Kribbella sp. VKM Ac-2566]|nr:hypothetical protein EV647_4678 [Kribbella sp. VKM Ac-2566]